MLVKSHCAVKIWVSLTVGRQSCFLTLVAAHLDAAVPREQELGAPPVIEVWVYRSGGYRITSDQGGTHLNYFFDESKRGQFRWCSAKTLNRLFSKVYSL